MPSGHLCVCTYSQGAVIEGTYLGIQHMSTKHGGKGGTIINVASLGGEEIIWCHRICYVLWHL